jgi:hypothetical protein
VGLLTTLTSLSELVASMFCPMTPLRSYFRRIRFVACHPDRQSANTRLYLSINGVRSMSLLYRLFTENLPA